MSQSTTLYRSSALKEIRRAITNVAVLHHEPPAVVWRRRVVVTIMLVIGVAVLGLSLRKAPDEPSFYWLMLALAAVWIAGAFISGPLHLGGICWRGRNQRPVITGTVIGVLLGGIFVLGGLIARGFPRLAEAITYVVQYTHQQGSFVLVVLITVVNTSAEEMFFRGALYTALGRLYPVATSTVLYIGAILASGNLMLGFAAIVLGTVCALERRASGGILAPMLTHFVWGLIMVLALPPLFGV